MFSDFRPGPVRNAADSAPVGEQLHPGLFGDVRREIARARAKHGWNQTPASGCLSDSECLVILVEEVGEVARAMTYDEGDPDNLDKELTQVAAMALAWRNGRRIQRQAEEWERQRGGNGDGMTESICHSVGYVAHEAPDLPLKVYDKLREDTGEIPVVRG